MTARKMKYFSALFHAILAIVCLIVQFFLGFIPNGTMNLTLFSAPIFACYFGWRMGHHYLPSKMGKYIYEPFQITLLVSFLSIFFVSLIFALILSYSIENLFLSIGGTLYTALITSFFGYI